MTYTIKLKGNELTLNSTATSVGNASIVRIVNLGGAVAVVTQTTNTAVQVGNCSIYANEEVLLQKGPTDVLTASANLQAVSIAFRD